jgi:hypothetical protein
MFETARKILDSNNGTRFGWIVEADGEAIGELQNARYYGMFYATYDIVPRTEQGRSILFAPDTWYSTQRELRFRNKEFNLYAENAFAGGPAEYIPEGKVNMRGLYVFPGTFSDLPAIILLWFLRAVRSLTSPNRPKPPSTHA